AAMNNTIGSGVALNELIFHTTAPDYSLTGNPIIFETDSVGNSPSISMLSSHAVTIGTAVTLANNLTIAGSGTGAVTFNGAISGAGSLTYNSPGTLTLGNASNTYTGSTSILSGTLKLGAGTAIPTNNNVFVQTGATFDIGSFSNSSTTAIGTLSLAGTFRVPTGAGDYYLNELEMSGGTVDFTGTSNFWLHFTPNGTPGIFIDSGTNTWTGAASSRIQNDTSAALP